MQSGCRCVTVMVKSTKNKPTRPRCFEVCICRLLWPSAHAENPANGLPCQSAAGTLREKNWRNRGCSVKLPHARVAKRNHRDCVALSSCRTIARFVDLWLRSTATALLCFTALAGQKKPHFPYLKKNSLPLLPVHFQDFSGFEGFLNVLAL